MTTRDIPVIHHHQFHIMTINCGFYKYLVLFFSKYSYFTSHVDANFTFPSREETDKFLVLHPARFDNAMRSRKNPIWVWLNEEMIMP